MKLGIWFWGAGLFLFLGSAFANQTIPEKLIANQPKQVLLNEVFEFRPIKDHHFNLKAPQKCGDLGWLEQKPSKMKCQFSKGGVQEVRLYLCDDANTYCVPKTFTVKVKSGKTSQRKNLRHRQVAKYAHKGPKGFLTNQPEKALKLAQSNKSLLFIDFFGAWCPPCNMLDEYVFDKKAFQKAAQKMILVRLDADAKISFPWKDKFHVGGYPTIVIADFKLREIDRMVGYHSLVAMEKWIREINALKNEPIQIAKEVLQGKQKSRVQMSLHKRKTRVGKWHYERAEYSEALTYLKNANTIEGKKHFYLTEIEIAKKKDDKKAVIACYTKLIKDFSSDIELVYWVYKLSGYDALGAKPFLKTAQESASDWRSKQGIEAYGFSKGDLSQIEAVLLRNVEKTEESKKVFIRSAREYLEMTKSSNLKVARGANLEAAYGFLKGGDVQAALKIYENLAKHYGDEFTFNYNYARALKETKSYRKAYKFALKALDSSYGDNWLRAIGLKAELEIALKDKAKAKRTLLMALKETKVPKATNVRAHRYVARLRDLVKETE